MSELKKLSEIDGADPGCPKCNGEGWVCENHLDTAWSYGDQTCCMGAGAPCVCNPLSAEPKRDDKIQRAM